MRKRLTASTLQDQTRMASSLMAADLGIRLLGPGASDNEVHRVASIFLNSLPQAELQDVYKVTARVAAESGEDFPAIDSQESPQPESTDTQQYVGMHEVSPDHSVADVAMNEKSPTQDPKASKKAKVVAEKQVKKACPGHKGMADMPMDGASSIMGEDVEGDSVKPDFLGDDVEDSAPPMPPEPSDDADDQDIDFSMSDSDESEDMEDKEKPEVMDPDDTEEDSDEDHLDSDGEGDEDSDDIFNDLDDEDSGLLDDPEDFGDDSDDFEMSDLDDLGDLDSDDGGDDLGIDDVEDIHRDVPSGAEASRKSASRVAKKNETFSGWDDVLSTKSKKSRTASFKPSRVRRASAQNTRSDVDSLFDVPDHDSVMREFRF